MDLCVKYFVYEDMSWDRVEGLTDINSANQGALGWFLFIQAFVDGLCEVGEERGCGMFCPKAMLC
jgi:hypothetical protein